MTTPAPAPAPSSQTGAPLVTYVLPAMAGKSGAVLDAERDCPSECQTARGTGSLAQAPASHPLHSGGEVTIPSCIPQVCPSPCLVHLSVLWTAAPLWLPKCPFCALFCPTGACPSFVLSCNQMPAILPWAWPDCPCGHHPSTWNIPPGLPPRKRPRQGLAPERMLTLSGTPSHSTCSWTCSGLGT